MRFGRWHLYLVLTALVSISCFVIILLHQKAHGYVSQVIKVDQSSLLPPLPSSFDDIRVAIMTPAPGDDSDSNNNRSYSGNPINLKQQSQSVMRQQILINNKEPVELLGWSHNESTAHPLQRIKVRFPIFHASLPKSGTTSTARYFYCGNIWTAHTFCNTVGTTHRRKQMRIGHCFLENLQAGRPPFHDCGNYHVWSDVGHPRGTPCFDPSVHGLEAFYEAYPNATLLLVTRNSTAWAQSVRRWKRGLLLKKWWRCKHFPGRNATDQDLQRFYEWHTQNIRNFVTQHPSLTYIEVALEDEAMGTILEERIGIPAQCFGHHNWHEKKLLVNPIYRRQFGDDSQHNDTWQPE